MAKTELSESIRDGSYFEEGRKWYSEVYVSLISERFLYLVLTSIAVLTSLLALIAVIRLLPIVPAVPFIIRSDNVVHDLPLIKPLAISREEDTNVAVRRFLAKQYVEYRENYAHDRIAERARVIAYWSGDEAYLAYRNSIDMRNPRSPVVLYESIAERDIDIEGAVITPNPSEGENAYIAKVPFVAYVIRLTGVESSNWIAELSFTYEDAVVNQEGVDDKTGKMKVDPMGFKVTSYSVRERKEELAQ